MSYGECRDSHDQLSAETHQKKQTNDEQQVVQTGKDVLYTQRDVTRGNFPSIATVICCAVDARNGLARSQGEGPGATVTPMHSQDGSGIARADTADTNLALQTRFTTVQNIILGGAIGRPLDG